MKNINTLFIAYIFSTLAGVAQHNADFEDILIAQDTFLNGSDGTMFFSSSGCDFPVEYDSTFGYWSGGFAMSTMRDTVNGDFTNLYSAYVQDVNSENIYAVANLGNGEVEIEAPIAVDATFKWLSIDVANTTYAHEVMQNGNAFAKKFGGNNGDDADYFFIRFYARQGTFVDSIDFYLADFRFEENSEDFILDDWKTVDLSALTHNHNRLSMKLFSSDTGTFGINTPLFFAVDNLKFTYTSGISTAENFYLEAYSVGDKIRVETQHAAQVEVFDLTGSLIYKGVLSPGSNDLHMNPQHRLLILRSRHDELLNTIKIFH